MPAESEDCRNSQVFPLSFCRFILAAQAACIANVDQLKTALLALPPIRDNFACCCSRSMRPTRRRS